MKKKVMLLTSAALYAELLKDRCAHKFVACVLAHQSKDSISKIINSGHKIDSQRMVSDSFDVIGFSELANLSPSFGAYPNADLIQSCREVLSRLETFLLVDRSSKRKHSNHLNVVYIQTIVSNCLTFLSKCDPDILLCTSTPHALELWVLALLAERQGRLVVVIERTPLPHRYWYRIGLSQEQPQPPIWRSAGWRAEKELTSETKEFLSRLSRQDDTLSLISLERQLKIYGSRTFSLLAEAMIWFQTAPFCNPLRRMLYILHKRKTYGVYKNLCLPFDSRVKYIVFFLHYQPERSSLPEAGIFVNQYLAIQALSNAVHSDWKIFVREHPSTWMRGFPYVSRDGDYYKSISVLPNVQLIENDVGTNSLIDSSIAVATLTGKVGFQALCRGKHVFAFGKASYREHPKCINVENNDDILLGITAALDNILDSEKNSEVITSYCRWVEERSIPLVTAPTSATNQERKARLLTMVEVIKQYVPTIDHV